MLRAQDLRAKVLRSTLPPSRRRQRRPDFETLESRQLLSTVDWISPTSGSWDVASNWSTGTIPGPGDDVVINVTGAAPPTLTIGSNVESVHSIMADDPLVISGGGLAITANSTISGGLKMTGGSLTASGSGISLTVTGTATVDTANLYAQDGASLSLAQQFPACGFRPENTLVLISHFANSLRTMLSRIPYLTAWANGVTRHGTCFR